MKPRVVIADTDADYVIPLQQKFVNDFFDKIDLEIMTDREYVEDFFEIPQTIDILIISEKLYKSSLQRHNIGNIFLMTEQYGGDDAAEAGVTKLYKYTGIREIFQEISAQSSELSGASGKERPKPKIVVVTSASGGTGKTVIAMGISAYLAKSYKRVLYINAARLQNFQYMLDNQEVVSSSDTYMKLANPTERIYEELRQVIRKEIFSYVPAFKAALLSVGIPYSAYGMLAKSAKESGDFDYVIVDAETSFDEEKIKLLDIADKVVVVLEQGRAAVQAANAFVSNISGAGSDKYVFICNKFEKDSFSALTSSEMPVKFTVNEYVRKFPANEDMKCEELSQNEEIKKAALWVS